MTEPRRQNDDFTGSIGAIVTLAVIFVLLIVFGVVVDSCHGQEVTQQHVFPVIARTLGQADTTWRAGLCLYNPHPSRARTEVVLVQGGELYGAVFAVGGGETVCEGDFIAEWFGLGEFAGGLLIRIDRSSDATPEPLSVIPSVWEHNDIGAGSFATEVVGMPVFEPSFASDYVPTRVGASGVQHYGEPGEDGFRSSVGAFNPGREEQRIGFQVNDGAGRWAWDDTVSVPGRSQVQIGLPRGVEVRGGSAIAVGGEGIPIYGYLTVTDNQTGSGVYKPMIAPWPAGEGVARGGE